MGHGCCGKMHPDYGTSNQGGTTLELLGVGMVEHHDDGKRYGGLSLVHHFLGSVGGFGIPGKLGIEVNGTMWAGIGGIHPRVADLMAYSASYSARPRKPHSSDCTDWRVWRHLKTFKGMVVGMRWVW